MALQEEQMVAWATGKELVTEAGKPFASTGQQIKKWATDLMKEVGKIQKIGVRLSKGNVGYTVARDMADELAEIAEDIDQGYLDDLRIMINYIRTDAEKAEQDYDDARKAKGLY